MLARNQGSFAVATQDSRAPCQRMVRFHQALQAFRQDVGVDLRGGDVGVAE
jgi:hypothetical protein